MGLTRVFYGHEGIVPPLGLYAPAEAEPILDAIVDEIELPGPRAKVAELNAFAEKYGIVFEDGASAKAKRAAIDEWAANLPELTAEGETLEDADGDESDGDESESDDEGDESDGDDEGADANEGE